MSLFLGVGIAALIILTLNAAAIAALLTRYNNEQRNRT